MGNAVLDIFFFKNMSLRKFFIEKTNYEQHTNVFERINKPSFPSRHRFLIDEIVVNLNTDF